MKNTRLAMWGMALIAAAVFAAPVRADIIAYWNFNTTPGSLYSWTADEGSGILTADPAWTQLSVTGGTTLNSISDPAGGALGLKSNDNNGLAMDFAVDTTGYEDIILSFSSTRNNQGFDVNTILYSTDGVNYTSFTSFNPSNGSYGLITADMSSATALNDAGPIFIRLLFDGAQNNNGTTSIDNVRIAGTLIPAPGALALLGAAGLIATRRRRR